MIPPVDGAAAAEEVVSCGLLLAEARVSDIIIAVVVYRSTAIGLSRRGVYCAAEETVVGRRA